MALNLDAIRKKLNQLNGQGKSKVSMWKPEENTESTVRLISFQDNDGQPFKERYFYYGIGKQRGLLAPNQFGKPDPIQELINKLREEGSKESYDLAKKLYPSMRVYAAVIVRGEEDKGVQIWSFGKKVYTSLINFILDEDYGDITDPFTGRDIRVTSTKVPGKTYADTDVRVRGKETKLAESDDQMKKWLDNIPDVDEMFQLKSYDELESIINSWLNGDDEEDANTSSLGTSRGQVSSTSQVQSSSPEVAQTFTSLDDAFAELES
jgi:hypothetical protein